MVNRLIFTTVIMTLCSTALADDQNRRGERGLKHLDTDGDGLISQAEFQLPQRGPGILEADTDGDNAVTLEELRLHHESRKAEHDARMAEHKAEMEKHKPRVAEHMDGMFTAMDTNGDGAVTAEEARLAMFNRMDKNGDGSLSADEMRPPRKDGKHMGMGKDRKHGDKHGE